MSAWVVPGYREERELGRGASSRVVAAVRTDGGQPVAIKYLAPRLFRDPNFLARFRAEVEVLRSLDVMQVVRLFDYVEEPGQGAAIVMELVDGVSLHEMITRQGATSPESALVVLMGSLLGLASAHQLGIVHRDYKPENVLVDGQGDSKLTDFGVAVKAGEQAPAEGTPLYMAPEQWTGEPATPATDIYAATAVFFECLTGKTPFSGQLGQLALQHQTAGVPVAMVDEPLQALIERGMAKDPAARPAHAVEFVAELIAVADEAYGPDWAERGRSQLAQRAAALLLLLLGGIAGAAGGSFAATLLGGIGSRKRAAIAGAAVGIVAAVVVTTTAFALQGNDSGVTATHLAGGRSAGGLAASAAATNSPAGRASATGSPTASVSSTGTPAASATATSSPPATAPATTMPATTAGATSSPTVSTPPTNPPTTSASAPTPSPSPTTTTPPTLPPAAPVIMAAANPVTVSGACPASLAALSVPGTISSTRATTVTYHWARSDATSTAPSQVTIPAGVTVGVADSVPAGSNRWGISDTLVVTSPSAHSASAKVAVDCSYPALTMGNPGTQSPPVGRAFSLALQHSGGNGPYQWSESGALPPGLSFSGGVITGTATITGRYPVTVTVTDTEASAQSASVTFIIDPYYLIG